MSVFTQTIPLLAGGGAWELEALREVAALDVEEAAAACSVELVSLAFFLLRDDLDEVPVALDVLVVEVEDAVAAASVELVSVAVAFLLLLCDDLVAVLLVD